MIHVLRRLFGTAANDRAPPPADPAPQLAIDPAHLPVLPAETLLQPHAKTLELIQRQVGIPLTHWTALYERLFHSFAAFVQQLPASEAHHHRQIGGLLAHSLDATLQALRIRRGILLPTGASAELLAEKQDVWTYATVTAALFHDLGKPVVDQSVQLFDAEGKSLGQWYPLSGAMPARAVSYRFSYVRGRRYRLHPMVPPLLVQHIVPAIGLDWLTQDIDVFECWLATITGGDSEFAGKLGQIIRQSDSLSVASDIAGAAGTTVIGNAPSPSFAERLAVALRSLIDTQTLPLNRAGAAGWVIGDDLWLVSKRALDALRDQLAKDSAGASAPRNERLMDELQQHGIVAANGDRAIWKATIELADWRQSFTLLRVPLNRLWMDPDSRPAAVAGRVAIDGEPRAGGTAGISPPEPMPHIATPSSSVPDVTEASAAIDLYSDLPLPPLPETETVHEPEHATDNRYDDTPVHAGAATAAPIPSRAESAVAPPVLRSGKPRPASSNAPPAANRDFIQWIREGVAAGRLNINTRQARLHVTQEGLLLVSPGIFRDFAGVEGWTKAQKTVVQLELHRRKPDGTNIWTYRVVGERKSGARLKGLLISDPATRLGLKLPEPNLHLLPLGLDGASSSTEKKVATTGSRS
jgi:integrating conjugative element relaxase (TIGR03760 family)